jgi:hypothetical protein
MASVSINEGMPRPEAPAMGLPRARWKLLAMARRRWAEVELPFDCRLLRTVVDEAPLLAEELGLGSGEEFLRDYLTLDLDLVQRVLGWLEQEQPTEAVPLQLVIEQAKAQPLAAHGEIGNGRKDESRGDNITSTERGTSQTYLLRRIARDHPQLLDQIGPGSEFRSARSAAIAAGIIKPVPTIRLVDDPVKVAAAIRKHLGPQQVASLVEELQR